MKIKNIKSIAFVQNLTKAYTEGVYADTPANRKLGRVGMSYAQYAQKIKEGNQIGQEKQKDENFIKDKENDLIFKTNFDKDLVKELNSNQISLINNKLKEAKKFGIPIELFTLNKDNEGHFILDIDSEAGRYYAKDRSASHEEYEKQEELDRSLASVGFGRGRGGDAEKEEFNNELNKEIKKKTNIENFISDDMKDIDFSKFAKVKGDLTNPHSRLGAEIKSI